MDNREEGPSFCFRDRMTNAASVTALVLAIAACGAASSRAKEPVSQTETTGVVVESGPAAPGDPTGMTTEGSGVTATSGAVASPMEGACPRGRPSRAATDLASCVKSCRGMDDQVPLGSRCTSQYASCMAECHASFKPE